MLLAWVLMPDHVHWLLQLGDVTPLARTVSCMKEASTRAVNRQRELPSAVWTRAYHDRALRKDDDLRIVACYLIANPLRAGMVERVGDYPFLGRNLVAVGARPRAIGHRRESLIARERAPTPVKTPLRSKRHHCALSS
ncbi:hypothetical protein FHR53_002572 [Xanthomonas arboricola]